MDRFDGRTDPPDFVSVETTRYCNLRCRMCVQFHDGTTVSGPHMPMEEFQRVVEQVFPYVSRWQPSVSGEPLMSQGFDEMLLLAEQFGAKAEVYSNATLLSDKRMRLLAANLATLTVSFDGATASTFEAVREGADFTEVCKNIKGIIAYARSLLPADKQPRFGLNFVMMEKNIRELPALVRLAAEELGVDFVACAHVFPITEEMKQQSLSRHRELAIAQIDAACREAERLGLELHVDALDQVVAATALSKEERVYAEADGTIAGLGIRRVERKGGRASRVHDQDLLAVKRARRRQALAHSRGEVDALPAVEADPPASAMWCDFLWNKTYVHIGGNVVPCCMHGAPVAGNLNEQDFLSIWNGPVYRQMRQRLAAGKPAPFCRGCTHLRTLTDREQIRSALHGTAAPTEDDLGALHPVLDPHCAKARRPGPPPVLEWDPVPGASDYVVECSLDEFRTILFATDGARGGPRIREPRWQVPPWAWKQAPVDHAIWWRAKANLSGDSREVASGLIPAVARGGQ